MTESPAFLLSYHWHRQTDVAKLVKACPVRPRLIADSGAFSAFSIGQTITVEEYAAWCDRWHGFFDAFFTLDVIGDHDGSRANWEQLTALGVETVPVYHLGEPESVLDHYLTRTGYVGVGGMVGKAYGHDVVLRHCARVHRMARATGTRLHGLGQTRRQQLLTLPWATVDSSSWGAGFRYGQIRVWDPKAHRLRDAKVGTPAAHALGELIRQAGSDPGLFSDRERYSYPEAAKLAAWSYHQMERWLAGRWQNPDFTLYLAEGSVENIQSAAEGIARGFHQQGAA